MANHQYTLNSYTADTWTDLADTGADAVILKNLRMTNTGTANATVSVQLTDAAGTATAVLVPAAILEPGGYLLDMQAMPLAAGTKVQIKADIAGMEFYLGGVS